MISKALRFNDKKHQTRFSHFFFQKSQYLLYLSEVAYLLAIAFPLRFAAEELSLHPSDSHSLAILLLTILLFLFCMLRIYLIGKGVIHELFLLLANTLLCIICLESKASRTSESLISGLFSYTFLASLSFTQLTCYQDFLIAALHVFILWGYLLVRALVSGSELAQDGVVLLENVLAVFLACATVYIPNKTLKTNFAEKNLLEKQGKSLLNFLEYLPQGVLILSQQKEALFVNRAMKTLFSSEDKEKILSEFLGLELFEAYSPQTLAKLTLDAAISESIKLKKVTLVIPKERNSVAEEEKEVIAQAVKQAGKGTEERHDSPKEEVKIQKSVPKKAITLFQPPNKTSQFSKKATEFPKKQDNPNTEISKYKKRKNTNPFLSILENSQLVFHKSKYLDVQLLKVTYENKKCILIFINDVTELFKVNIERDVSEYKNLIFRSISHELRTPLNCINCMISGLIQEASVPSPLVQSYLLPAFCSCHTLELLVNNILDYSLIMMDRLDLDVAKLDLEETLLSTMSLFAIQARQRGLTFALVIRDNIPKTILSDKQRIKQILAHLLANSIKFTYEGLIRVCLKPKNSTLVISVMDSGLGMNRNQQKELYNLLNSIHGNQKQIDSSSIGASLGLTVSQALALKLGVRNGPGICFKSLEGCGSKFSFAIQVEDECLSQESCVRPQLQKLNSCGEISVRKKAVNMNDYEIEHKALENGILVQRWVRLKIPKERPRFDYFSGKFKNESYEKKITKKMQTDIPARKRGTISPKNKSLEVNDSISHAIEPDLILTVKKGSFKFWPEKGKKEETKKECSHVEILIADDEEFNLLAMKTLFEKKGKRVKCAYNGQIAVDMVSEELESRKSCSCRCFKLIIFDFNMPIMGGIEAAGILKQQMDLNLIPRIPMIGCTAFVKSDQDPQDWKAVMDDFYSKPLNVSKIDAILKKWIKP